MLQLSIVGILWFVLCIIVGVVEYVWWCKNGDDGKFEGSGVDVVILFMLWLVSVIIIV